MCKIRILLAEDNPDHRQLLLEGLSRTAGDVDIHEVTTADEVFSSLQHDAFDCVVLDFNLPPFDAPEILRRAHGNLGNTPVVVISSSDDQQIVIESLRLGVADFVPKDQAILGTPLLERIRAAIDRSNLLQEGKRKQHRRIEHLRQVANEDPLTGLCNRRAAARALRSERCRADRRVTTSCVALDLDHFKTVNDTHGHAAGDRVLAAVADVLRRNIAPSDTAVRWGGEEFLAILSSTPPARAWGWAERVRRQIAALEIPANDQVLRITASFGIATVPSKQLGEETVRNADAGLYLAKELGRNRVCTSIMADAYHAARRLHDSTRLTWAERSETLRAMCNWLGVTQAEHTGSHSRMVRDLAIRIGRAMQLSGHSLNLLQFAAMLHDIGKVAVAEEVLAKPAPLTAEERAFVDEHARFGGELCRAMGMPQEICDSVSAHHERFDRRKAPGSWAGIIAVADAFVSMTSARSYSAPRSPEKALQELRRESGHQFDPDVVRAFESLASSDEACPFAA
ncbi:MAG: diguanylate cyclase [Phycisphaerales bacterium]